MQVNSVNVGLPYLQQQLAIGNITPEELSARTAPIMARLQVTKFSKEGWMLTDAEDASCVFSLAFVMLMLC